MIPCVLIGRHPAVSHPSSYLSDTPAGCRVPQQSASRLPPAAAPSTGPTIAIATGRSADRLGRGDGRRVQRRLHIWRGRKAWDLRGLGFVDRAGLGQGDHAGDGPDSIDGYQDRAVEDGGAAGFRLDRDLWRSIVKQTASGGKGQMNACLPSRPPTSCRLLAHW